MKLEKNNTPWHTVSAGKNVPETVICIIEIPQGSRAKYEMDKESGLLRLDRVLYSSVYYPANYGFIPQTFCGDGDPLDILVLSQINLNPLCLVEATVIGVMRMIDSGKDDDKIIAVATHDASVNHIQNIEELPEHFILELRQFFEEYKKLENKTVDVEKFQSKKVAHQIIHESIKLYKKIFGAK